MGDTGVMHTEKLGAGLRAAQVIGLTSTAFLAGKTFSNSVSTVPALLLAPAPLLAKQWKKMFDSDKAMAPVVVLFSGSVFGFLAYKEPSFSTNTARLYTAAASLLAICIPYSFLVLEPTNQKLEAKAASISSSSTVDTAAEHGVKKEGTTHYLVDQWASANLGRTVLTSLAAILSTWAAVERLKVGKFRVVSGAERLGRPR